VDLADDLHVERAGPPGGLEFTCDAPGVPSDATNLAVRAAHVYREASGWKEGLRIRLEKKIPAGGGLGGGSSDAAAVLRAMQQLSGSALAPERLMECARGLGSDVPFFAADLPWALGRERGDRIEPAAVAACLWHLLVTPDFPVPTKEVYRAFKLTPPHADATLLIRALEQRKISPIRDHLFNALEPTVEQLYPETRRVKAEIEEIAGLSRPMVSGSGSSVFALCESREEAESAAEKVKRRHPSWQVHAVRTT
jgi:4-diphosphocytidyl-2-C-methyl-D-erythritol kinase